MPKLNLTRDVLAKIAQGNQRAVAALEQVFEDVGDTFPSTIETFSPGNNCFGSLGKSKSC